MPDSGSRSHITQEEATRLWERASELQSEATRREEFEALSAAEEDGATSDANAATDGYALEHVRAAAVEAGIGAEYVDAALADIRTQDALTRASPAERRPISRRLLANPPASVTVTRVIRAAPVDVVKAMEAVLPAEPFSLVLQNRQGDPLNGGVLEFDIPGATFTPAGVTGFALDASWADMRTVIVSLRPVPGSQGRTEVTVGAPVAWAWRINAAVSGGLAAGAGMVGMGIGLAIGAAVAMALASTGVGTVVGVGIAMASAGGAGGGALKGLQVSYRYGLRRGEKGLQGLMAAVAIKAEGGWGLTEGKPSLEDGV